MDQHHLIEMANQIGGFFESMPDREEATAGVADHIRRFWEPRMRRALYAAFDTGTPGISEIVSNALTKYREQLTPVAA